MVISKIFRLVSIDKMTPPNLYASVYHNLWVIMNKRLNFLKSNKIVAKR